MNYFFLAIDNRWDLWFNYLKYQTAHFNCLKWVFLYMQVSKRQINKNLQKEIFQILYQLIADLKNPQEVALFFEDVLGKNETIALAKRLAVAYYLTHGRSYENIKQNLKVSSATVASVDKARKSKGYILALKKIEAEKWASKWTGKIESLFRKK